METLGSHLVNGFAALGLAVLSIVLVASSRRSNEKPNLRQVSLNELNEMRTQSWKVWQQSLTRLGIISLIIGLVVAVVVSIAAGSFVGTFVSRLK